MIYYNVKYIFLILLVINIIGKSLGLRRRPQWRNNWSYTYDCPCKYQSTPPPRPPPTTTTATTTTTPTTTTTKTAATTKHSRIKQRIQYICKCTVIIPRYRISIKRIKKTEKPKKTKGPKKIKKPNTIKRPSRTNGAKKTTKKSKCTVKPKKSRAGRHTILTVTKIPEITEDHHLN